MGRSEIIIFQHVEWEKPGRIAYAFEDSGLDYSVLNISKEKKADLPDIAVLQALGVTHEMRLRAIPDRLPTYLAYHRQFVFITHLAMQ